MSSEISESSKTAEEVFLRNLDEFHRWVLTQSFSKSALVLLRGPMGAGKTEFVKTWVQSQKNLSVSVESSSVEVSSPTFAIHNSYIFPDGRAFHHFDLFRIESEDELEGTGFWDILNSEFEVCFIEWPDRVAEDHWPLQCPRICYEWTLDLEQGVRRIRITSAPES